MNITREELEALRNDTNEYVSKIFDQVGPLGMVGFLWQVQGFQRHIESLLDGDVFPAGDITNERIDEIMGYSDAAN